MRGSGPNCNVKPKADADRDRLLEFIWKSAYSHQDPVHPSPTSEMDLVDLPNNSNCVLIEVSGGKPLSLYWIDFV